MASAAPTSDHELPLPSLSDLLVIASAKGDLPAAKAAVADGARVNDKGNYGVGNCLALAAAVCKKHPHVVAWLLGQGADPEGEHVMYRGAVNSTPEILQLLIDAGSGVNQVRVFRSIIRQCYVFFLSGCLHTCRTRL